jgi:uncharacterized protein (TIGR00730 family)
MPGNNQVVLGIFSSSRTAQDIAYVNELNKIGNSLSTEDFSVRYGGGDAGAMGIIPKIFASRDGVVNGVDCKKFHDKYGAASFGTTTVYDTFEERQQMLLQGSDVILCLPGGIGTLSELFDVLVLNDLSIVKRKVLLFNWNGVFDPILEFIQKGIENKFITNWEKLDITVVNSAQEVLDNLS